MCASVIFHGEQFTATKINFVFRRILVPRVQRRAIPNKAIADGWSFEDVPEFAFDIGETARLSQNFPGCHNFVTLFIRKGQTLFRQAKQRKGNHTHSSKCRGESGASESKVRRLIKRETLMLRPQ